MKPAHHRYVVLTRQNTIHASMPSVAVLAIEDELNEALTALETALSGDHCAFIHEGMIVMCHGPVNLSDYAKKKNPIVVSATRVAGISQGRRIFWKTEFREPLGEFSLVPVLGKKRLHALPGYFAVIISDGPVAYRVFERVPTKAGAASLAKICGGYYPRVGIYDDKGNKVRIKA